MGGSAWLKELEQDQYILLHQLPLVFLLLSWDSWIPCQIPGLSVGMTGEATHCTLAVKEGFSLCSLLPALLLLLESPVLFA